MKYHFGMREMASDNKYGIVKEIEHFECMGHRYVLIQEVSGRWWGYVMDKEEKNIIYTAPESWFRAMADMACRVVIQNEVLYDQTN